MAFAIPFVAAVAAGAGAVTLALTGAAAALGAIGALSGNKTLTKIGSFLGIASGIVGLAGAAGSAGSAIAGAGETAAGMSSEIGSAMAAAGDAGTSIANQVAGALGGGITADAGAMLSQASDPLVGAARAGETTGIIGERMVDRTMGLVGGAEQPWGVNPRVSIGEMMAAAADSGEGPSPIITGGARAQSPGLVERVMGWAEKNPLLTNTMIGAAGRFIERGFARDPNAERVELERRRQEIELELLRERLARANNMASVTIPFRANLSAPPVTGYRVPYRNSGIVGGAMQS